MLVLVSQGMRHLRLDHHNTPLNRFYIWLFKEIWRASALLLRFFEAGYAFDQCLKGAKSTDKCINNESSSPCAHKYANFRSMRGSPSSSLCDNGQLRHIQANIIEPDGVPTLISIRRRLYAQLAKIDHKLEPRGCSLQFSLFSFNIPDTHS